MTQFSLRASYNHKHYYQSVVAVCSMTQKLCVKFLVFTRYNEPNSGSHEKKDNEFYGEMRTLNC